MLPSRVPIQVTLEDSSTGTSRAIRCKPQIAQVKILRRPIKPNTANTSQKKLANEDKLDASTNSQGQQQSSAQGKEPQSRSSIFEERLISQKVQPNIFEQAAHIESSSMVRKPISQPTVLTRETLTSGSIMRESHPSSYQHSTPDSDPALSSLDSSHHDCSNNSQPPPFNLKQSSATFNNCNSNLNNKRLMKTYQERADEYARARLRILGSAFPDYDSNSLTTNDDNVNRALTLNTSGGDQTNERCTVGSSLDSSNSCNSSDNSNLTSRVYNNNIVGRFQDNRVRRL